MKLQKVFILILFLSVLSISTSIDGQTPYSNKPLKYGRNAVGFKVIKTFDYSRNFKAQVDFEGKVTNSENARPMTIYLWYPAQPVAGKSKMPFSEYVDLEEISVDGKPWTDEDRNKIRSSFQRQITHRLSKKIKVTDDYFQKLLDQKTQAYKDAPHRDRKFPLLLYTSINPTSQSVLGEYFASHGYVTAGIQRKDNMSKEFLQFRPNPLSLDTSVADIEFLFGYFRKSSYADTNHLGTIAFSSASLANILFQMRNFPAGVLVSFEGWEGFKKGDEIIKESKYYNPIKIRVPYLRIGKAAEERQPSYATTYNFFNAIKYSNRFDIRFKDAKHPSFLSTEMSTNTYSEKERLIYKTALRKLRTFLGAFLKNDRSDTIDIFKEGRANSSNDLYSMTFKKALPPAPSEEEFYRILEEKGGVERAWKIYFDVKKREPKHKIFRENVISRVASSQNEIKDQLKLRQIIADAYPESYIAVFNLGSAQNENGQNKEALKNIEQALNLLSQDNTVSDSSRKRYEGIIKKELNELKNRK